MITLKQYTETILESVSKTLNLNSLQREAISKQVRKYSGYREYRDTYLGNKKYKKPQRLKRQSTPIDLYKLDELQRRTIEIALKINKIDVVKFCQNTNKREHVDCRRQLLYIFRYYQGYTLELAASVFNKDHSTVIHALRKHHDFMAIDRFYSRSFNQLVEELKSNNIIKELL